MESILTLSSYSVLVLRTRSRLVRRVVTMPCPSCTRPYWVWVQTLASGTAGGACDLRTERHLCSGNGQDGSCCDRCSNSNLTYLAFWRSSMAEIPNETARTWVKRILPLDDTLYTLDYLSRVFDITNSVLKFIAQKAYTLYTLVELNLSNYNLPNLL